jgi:hypothetical protein
MTLFDSGQGLGSPVFDKLEAELAKAAMSLPATKGFEIGSGFAGIPSFFCVLCFQFCYRVNFCHVLCVRLDEYVPDQFCYNFVQLWSSMVVDQLIG